MPSDLLTKHFKTFIVNMHMKLCGHHT